jgi:hypothetical protein
MLDVAYAGNADIQPSTFGVRFIDFTPRRRRQALHAVVATTKQDSAQDVDHNVQSRIEALHAVTVAFPNDTRFRSRETPYCGSHINAKYNACPHCEMERTKPPV